MFVVVVFIIIIIIVISHWITLLHDSFRLNEVTKTIITKYLILKNKYHNNNNSNNNNNNNNSTTGQMDL